MVKKLRKLLEKNKKKRKKRRQGKNKKTEIRGVLIRENKFSFEVFNVWYYF